jgi:dynein heavy chain 1
VCQVRDIPPVSGSVIRAIQIERHLNKLLDRVKTILGSSCFTQREGKEVEDLVKDFIYRLKNYNEVAKEWGLSTHTVAKTFNFSHERVLKLSDRRPAEITVNFDYRLIDLMKEIRNFLALDIKLSARSSLSFYAIYTKSACACAVSLRESIYLFSQIISRLDSKISLLMAEANNNVLKTLKKGVDMLWSNTDSFIYLQQTVAESVLGLHELVTLVLEKNEQNEGILMTLPSCPLEHNLLREKLASIQSVIYSFHLKRASNLSDWTRHLNEQIERHFLLRARQLIAAFVREFEEYDEKGGMVYIEKPLVLELKMQENRIYLDPPIEFARQHWYTELHRVLGILTSLPKIETPRDGFKKAAPETFESLIDQVDRPTLRGAYSAINRVVTAAEKYTTEWTNYQALWDIDVRKVYDFLKEEIDKWQELLNELKRNRKTFDNSETEKQFGPVIIDYSMVQEKINHKYDNWHKEILNHFGEKLADRVKGFHGEVARARERLEKINFSSGIDVIQAISDFQAIKKKNTQWVVDIDTYTSSFKLLERQRYSFPQDWLEESVVEAEWAAFRQIFLKKSGQLEAETPKLQAMILADEQALLERVKELDQHWANEKPSARDCHPKEAQDLLTMLGQRTETLRKGYENCLLAKELLGLDMVRSDRLEVIEEEIEGLREVWQGLAKAWAPLDSLREQLVSAVTNKRLAEITEESKKVVNNLPLKLKSYEAFERTKARLEGLAKMNKTIKELKSDAMQAKHWKLLLQKTKSSMLSSEVTFGGLWALDLNRYEGVIKDILNIARGEKVLEDMLRGVKDYWAAFELELAQFQNKCKLIKGWDDLFEKLNEDLASVSSMKISPYYKTFESEITAWDEKLQRLRLTLDTWIEVQKRWVYLYGIFFGSSDIKEMLSNEFTRFKGIDSEFSSLMKKVAAKPNLLEVMNYPNLAKTLERLADMLANVQKALGDYLEKQRAQLARFYFVGDEDLLEIIGNSKDVAVVQRHFNKMYAGITSLRSTGDPEKDLILEMASREGEVVPLRAPVSISEDPKINVWLTKVETEMQVTLATLLEESVREIAGDDRADTLIEIIEKYPAQVVILGLEVLWNNKVEAGFEGGLEPVLEYLLRLLAALAERVMTDMRINLRQKFEQAITDYVHQRDVVRLLIRRGVRSEKEFSWQYYMRMAYFPKEQDVLKKLEIRMANTSFHYGFEYLGVGEKLVQTPLTDKCYLTLTQALHLRMGGSPFGPAGTGKTESVKALGSQLGRFVLVFNCDDTFDFHAMGRIFIGLCQVGAWGCFDEFNRLEERMLSACSQQILIIQAGLRKRQPRIELMGREVRLNFQMGVFVTMNPGYAGRSNLPENLKQLFRQMAMVKPDRELIAEVMLYSQGYRTAEKLAGKVVSLFELCADQLSSQPHYDFGLRSLKSVLVSAGNMKREEAAALRLQGQNPAEFVGRDIEQFEMRILMRSICETMVPKLIAEDVPLL